MEAEGDTALNFAALQLRVVDSVGLMTPLSVLVGASGSTVALRYYYDF